MSEKKIRILLVADTHLGFDLPFRPRVIRRRRGHEFFANFERALQPAYEGKVDLVLHGGDLFYRSRVPEALVHMAMAPLIDVADRGIPVYVVPGNHERSRIPLHLWSAHPNLHIFDEAKTYNSEIRGIHLSLSGFPFAGNIRDQFTNLVVKTGCENNQCDVRILCMHQTVEGAQVGPSNYTFRDGPDVIRGKDIPETFSMVLSGHIHRAQMLTSDLKGRPLKAPVIYPGSVERTSFAEREEDKQYVLIDAVPDGSSKGQLVRADFIPLPTRPMVTIDVELEGKDVTEVNGLLKRKFSELDPDSVVRIRLQGNVSEEVSRVFAAQHLRSIAPASMNVSVSYPHTRISVDGRGV